MARKPREYRRLPGRAKEHFALLKNERCSLWLGSDHLLHIRKQYYREANKRFYFKDIQALSLCRTSSGRTINFVLGGCLAAFILVVIAGGYYGWATGGILGFVPGVLFWGLLLNIAFGPTCACHIHTAVQTERLPSLGRLRTAQKTIAMLKPFIEAAQGRLAPEDIEAHTDEQTEVQASAHALERDPRYTGGAEFIRHENGSAHSILFFCLLPLAASNAAAIFSRDTWLTIYSAITYLLVLVFLLMALVRQRNSDIPLNLRTVTWVVLGALCADFIFGISVAFVYGFVSAFNDPNYFSTYYFDLDDIPLGWPPLDYYLLTVTLIYITLALVGLFTLRDFRRRYAALVVQDKDEAIHMMESHEAKPLESDPPESGPTDDLDEEL